MRPPIYHTHRFVLRPYSFSDEERFVETMMDALTQQFMGNNASSEEGERALFRKIFEVYDNKDSSRWFWIWGVYKDNRFCAHFELKDTSHTQADELEIVYATHPDERGKGLMSEVLAFVESQQVHWKRKIIATVSPENKGSLSLLEKWGIMHQEIIKDTEGGGDYLKIKLKPTPQH